MASEGYKARWGQWDVVCSTPSYHLRCNEGPYLVTASVKHNGSGAGWYWNATVWGFHKSQDEVGYGQAVTPEENMKQAEAWIAERVKAKQP